MSDQRTPEPFADDVLRAWAEDERTKGEELATLLEDIAKNGLPDPATGTEWSERRERHLSELAAGQNGSRAA